MGKGKGGGEWVEGSGKVRMHLQKGMCLRRGVNKKGRRRVWGAGDGVHIGGCTRKKLGGVTIRVTPSCRATIRFPGGGNGRPEKVNRVRKETKRKNRPSATPMGNMGTVDR